MPRLFHPLLLLVLAITLGLVGLYTAPALGGPPPGRTAVPSLPLSSLGHRLLILAPHPDDEVLGAGGAMRQALAAGDAVWVAVVTSGESSAAAARAVLHVAHPTPADFARLGALRRQESREGTAVLGLPRSHLLFLGYADGSLTPLWLHVWNCHHPRVSGGTHVARSLLAYGFHPHVAYCAPNLLADLERLLRLVHPDAVLLPDLADWHPDHAGLADFAWAAVLAYDRRLPPSAPRPRLYGYLVHYPGFPADWGVDPRRWEEPPTAWTGGAASWFALPLRATTVRRLGEALSHYRSQLLVSRPFLEAFVRRDELFTCRPLVTPLAGNWRTLAAIRLLRPEIVVTDDGILPGVGLMNGYAGPPLTLSARAEGGHLALRFAGLTHLGDLRLHLYAWQVSSHRRLRRDALSWWRGHAVGHGPTTWHVGAATLTWTFPSGKAIWQVAARLVDPSSGAAYATPWLAVTGGQVPGWARNPCGVGPTTAATRRP